MASDGAALTGDAVAVLRTATARIDVYDALSGALLHSWPAPGAESTASYLQAGGGIVADSDPAEEHQECLNKLAALERAIELAEAEQR